MRIAKKKKAKLIFNVSDLWPESAEKLGVVTNKTLLKMAYNLEEKLYKRAVLVTGQTQGICKNIRERFPDVQTYWLPNGVDLEYYDPKRLQESDWRKKNGFSDFDFIFLYAGIIGIAQGLEIILQAAAHFKNDATIKFVLMGSGPEKERLLKLKEKLHVTNVTFLNPVTKKEMPAVLSAVNAAIIPLKKLDIFLGAIPSKIFENLAMEIPILLGVDGEARELFITQGNCGVYFKPGDVHDLISAITKMTLNREMAAQFGKHGRAYVNEHFNREIIAKAFYGKLKTLG